MKKRARKLRLLRETLQSLDASDVQQAAAGGFACGSDDCSQSCEYTAPNFTQCGPTLCICAATATGIPEYC